MGKYMKKSKITGDIAVMEVSISPQSSLGVRTRAKTLALQKLQQQSQSLEPDSDSSSLYYLQLRSRRLEKPPLRNDAKKQSQSQPLANPRDCCAGNGGRKPMNSRPNSRLSVGSSADLGWDGSVERKDEEGEGRFRTFGSEAQYGNDTGVEASFGENNLEFEGRDRYILLSLSLSLCVIRIWFCLFFSFGSSIICFSFFFGLLILKMALFFSLCLFVEYEFLLVMVSGMGSSFIDVFNSVNTFFEKEKIELCE